ncbi:MULTISPECIES: ATP-binding response regulator [Paraburkholderia]|uniref:histidine kinase n=1 Tax=Paraburkholderia podalyriae TaxID=1938811 RepID=A0ABR7PSM8_9BURK|nr:ATP-binding protein [Paraburkholderia podalyriae]MBC8749278.1 response regulator [Paraburkholderia podalyriae]
MTAPTYRWRFLPDEFSVRLEGPLSRPSNAQRRVTVSLADSPQQVMTCLASPDTYPLENTTQSVEVTLGKRTFNIIGTAPNAGYIVDLSPILRRLARAQQYARLMEEGINALPEGYVLYDNQDRLLIANPQYSALYPTISDIVRPGVSFSEIVNTSIARGQMQLNGETATDWIRRRLDFHRKGVGFFEQHLDDGRWLSVSERRTASGGITSVRSDITVLKQREQELRFASETAQSRSNSITRFLAIFSHEVRNGLNGIVGLAQILAFNARVDGEHGKSKLLLESTQRLSTVLSDLLEYLKSEATDFSVTLSDVDPRFLMEAISMQFAPRALERGSALVIRVAPDVPAVVRGDPTRIQQVVANLVSNAIKYSTQGMVAVAVTCEGNHLRYEVTDEGIGIAADDVPGLFEFFSRSAPDNPLSTGLGLAISKKLVAAMGGEIGVQSRLGVGSRFWFDLPLIAVRTPTPSELAVVPCGPSRRLSVGVIDDDLLNRAIAEDLLRQMGHTPHVFIDGDALLRHMAAHPLDAVLLDLMMPNETGQQIAGRIRATIGPAYEQLAILLVTGNVLSDVLVDVGMSGIDAVLPKPLLLEILGAALQSAVSRRLQGLRGRTAPAAVTEAESQLERLRLAIGERRFDQSLRSADRLLSDTLAAIEANALDTLTDLVHRIAGNAAALGFASLGAAASALENQLRKPASTDVQRRSLLDATERQARVARQVLRDKLAMYRPARRRPRSR